MIRNLFPSALRMLFAVAFVFIAPVSLRAQKGHFSGMLEYRISVQDSSLRSLYPDNSMLIYTNDTIVRQETGATQLGKQVTIRHMEKNKSYLLLETGFGNFAIPTDLNELIAKDSIPKPSKYHFTKKGGKRKVLGKKARRMLVTHEDTEGVMEFLYFKDIDKKYNAAFPELPGLPVKYYVITPDATFEYELVRISEYSPNRDLFGIPSDFERISFDEFIERMLSNKGNPEIVPE